MTSLRAKVFTRKRLMAVYGRRWGIEELWKASKRTMGLVPLHGKTARTIRQEIYAHMVAETLARFLANAASRKRESECNFKQAFVELALHFLALLSPAAGKRQKAAEQAWKAVTRLRQSKRPGRSYPRRSMRPPSKWSATKSTWQTRTRNQKRKEASRRTARLAFTGTP
jgi:hypothetical protein